MLNGKKDGRRDGVFSETSRAYGYNDSADFERPEHYIRHIEPIESELKNQVEYDMDEQDQEWLDDLNRERKKEQSDPISYELFEIVMDRFEKEWFDLTKLIPNTKASLPSEDSPCGVCDDGEGENSNAIVFCDGCNLAVHQDCYGVPYIPEGQWLCRKCTVSPENPVSCVLCPAEGGAFKQTSSGQWAHLLCAIWIPEVGVGNSVYMEPIDGIENVPKSRWKLPCSICKQKGGACIQCDSKTCYTAFHVSCGRENGLLGSMKTMGEGHGPGGGDGVLRGWCEKHVPLNRTPPSLLSRFLFSPQNEVLSLHAQRHPHSAIAARLAQAPSSSSSSNSHKKGASGRGGGAVQAVVIKKTKKSARAYAKTYLPPPPLVPAKILGDIAEYVARMPGRKKKELIELVGRYWSLKREARRGAPLLKRLHLEPWTASGARVHTEAEKAKKMEYLVRVRNDLEKVRMLAELVRKREKEKLRQAQIYKQVLDSVLFPHDTALRLCMEKISSQDRTEVFLHPVSRIDVPDYHEVIKKPMAWETIEEKLENHHYVNVQEFQDDINLVFDNAQLYNDPESAIHKLAVRLQKAAAPFLAELDPIKTAPSSVSSLLQIPPSDIASAATSTAAPAEIEVDAEGEADAEGEPDEEEVEALAPAAVLPPSPPPPPPPPPPALAPFEVDVDMEEPAPAPEAPPKGRKPWDPVKDKERRALRAAEKEAAKVERREKKLAKAAELKAAAEVEINNEGEVGGEGGGGDQLEAGPSVVVASTEPQEQPVEAYSPEASSTRATRTRAA
ncbi:PHD-zinc-finger like domain-containing protein, partial [Mrakia frigida]|uniref:PHD-zinc-finger like domain-containing protein n=1 Tax=Mrakia frigida TaxID=29902 RepID=UPI003FCC0C9D